MHTASCKGPVLETVANTPLHMGQLKSMLLFLLLWLLLLLVFLLLFCATCCACQLCHVCIP